MLIENIKSRFEVYKEIAIILTYTIAVALTSIFIYLGNGFNSSFFNFLFGNINTISSGELLVIFATLIFTICFVYFNYQKLVLISLEPATAFLYTKNVKLYNYLFMIILAIAITVAIKLVGVLMVSALIIVPVLTAMRLSKSLKKVFFVAILLSEFAIISGLFIAYYINLPSGAVIVLFSLMLYLISFYKK